MFRKEEKGNIESYPKLLKNMMAWDRIELPTRG